jgi:hypothetical protein
MYPEPTSRPHRHNSNLRPPGQNRFKKGRSERRIELLENWVWGLSLIAMTITIHAGGVAVMTFVTPGIRIRLERESRLKSRHVCS